MDEVFYNKHELVYKKNDKADHLYIVIEGQIYLQNDKIYLGKA